MIAQSYDRRTLANMELALDRACKSLATEANSIMHAAISPARFSNALRAAIERLAA